MTKKSTKKALVLSVLSLVVCITMLVGTTFAWFTDSVTSTNNIIKSGNLDVVLEYYDTDADKWVEVNENTTLFSEETLWEPGYTEVVYLRVSNAGSLALKYQLGVNIVSETEGKNQDGDDFKLSDYIYFGAVEGQSEAFADRDAARAAVENAQQISAGYTKADAIKAGDPADYVALVVYMPETVGNVANHNGTNVPEIKLGVNLAATQYTAESDSFDNMYDELASFEVSTAEELLALLASGDDAYITLGANIELTDAASVAADATVVLDLNGKTISTATGYAIYNELGSTLIIDDKAGNGEISGAIYNADGSVITVNGGTFSASETGKYVFMNYSGYLTINDATINAGSTYPIYSYGADNTLVINDADVNATFGCVNAYGTNSKVVINGGTYTMTGVQGNTSHIAYFANGNVTINGGTFEKVGDINMSGTGGGGVCAIHGANLTVNGGNFAGDYADVYNWSGTNANGDGVVISLKGGTYEHDPSAYVAEGYTATQNADGTWTVGGYKVATAQDLTAQLAAGNSVVLVSNINTEAATTAPYGNKYAFKLDSVTLDGNGNELYMECYGDDYGIMTTGGTIKNVTITEGCRAVMIMYPTEDVILDNVNIGGDGVLYPINTGEAGAEGVNLIVTNSVLAGWTSFEYVESASFTNVEFKQGTYYNDIRGRVLKPYVNTTLTDCSFIEHMNLDLSSLGQGQKVTIKNCTVNGQKITADTFTVAENDSDYDTELFTVDLPSWADSIADCIVFE